MKIILVAALVAVLAFAAVRVSAQKAVGYDIGGCSPSDFVAAHIEYTADSDVTFVLASTKADEVVKLETPVIYKFAKEDEAGKHYVSGTYDIVINVANEKDIEGAFLHDGKLVALLFGIPGDGTNLAETAKREAIACKELIQQTAPAPRNVKTA